MTDTAVNILTGRWLHYGVTHHEPGVPEGVWSPHSWDATCAQARSWGMSGVHPKVADGTIFWYDTNGLTMLRDTAHRHGLGIAPMHYCWGNTRGSSVQKEASVAATIGKLFGIVVPDMEDPWFGQPQWMQEFGYSIRHNYGYIGHVMPTTYANPSVQSRFPYVQMNAFATAWIPQVYFNVWTHDGHPMTAREAVDYVFPQWQALDAQCQKAGTPLKPILPLISLTDGIAQQEVTNWLTAMQHYGYCGFWYDGVYSPYAETILKAPVPALETPEPPPPPVVVQPPAAAPAPPPSLLTAAQEQQFQDVWNSTAHLNLVPQADGTLKPTPFPYTTGIAGEWKHYRLKYDLGAAIVPEFASVDWNGEHTIFQSGGDWECQYQQNPDGSYKGSRWWRSGKEITL